MSKRKMFGALVAAVLFGVVTVLSDVVTYSDNTASAAVSTVEAATFKLSDKQYKQVKGWWTQCSSGGYDVKFTRTKVKYYDRDTGKVVFTYTIKKCKKKNGVYIYYLKSGNVKFELRTIKDDKSGLEYFGSWDDKNIGNYYSGSSSMMKGKWN